MEPLRDPEEIETEILNRLAAVHGLKVLEIGAGSGRLTWRYADFAASVAGIDPDADRLAGAVDSRPAGLATPLQLAQAQAEWLPFRNEVFGAVILAWSL